jgi:hypothetical protein
MITNVYTQGMRSDRPKRRKLPGLATGTRAVLLLSLSIGGVGCYEIHEEIWIRDDGTVRYDLDYAFPEFMLVTVSEVDGGDADSALARFRQPPIAIVEGDSVWNRDHLDGDLRHFVSERKLASIDRLVALADRMEAMMDSVLRQAERRDSLERESLKRPLARRAPTLPDSASRTPEAAQSPPRSPLEGLMGQVLAGYDAASLGTRRIRLTHSVFPRSSRSQMVGSGGPVKDVNSSRRVLAGRTYSYRLHAFQIVSSNGTISEDRRTVEWSFPMTETIGDSARTLEAVIEMKSPR